MMKRAIILFPKFKNLDAIQSVRERLDPLAHYIAPHITLVFPFESDCSTQELQSHMKNALAGVKKFPVLLQGVTGDDRDGYLFLNVKQGNDNIINLHDRLYNGVLEPFLFRKVTYCPHITVGRIDAQSAFDQALEELECFKDRFEAVIAKVYVEKIDALEQSVIEFSHELE